MWIPHCGVGRFVLCESGGVWVCVYLGCGCNRYDTAGGCFSGSMDERGGKYIRGGVGYGIRDL